MSMMLISRAALLTSDQCNQKTPENVKKYHNTSEKSNIFSAMYSAKTFPLAATEFPSKCRGASSGCERAADLKRN
jgi:hypothetical protein